jgi:hypothetical protein
VLLNLLLPISPHFHEEIKMSLDKISVDEIIFVEKASKIECDVTIQYGYSRLPTSPCDYLINVMMKMSLVEISSDV